MHFCLGRRIFLSSVVALTVVEKALRRKKAHPNGSLNMQTTFRRSKLVREVQWTSI